MLIQQLKIVMTLILQSVTQTVNSLSVVMEKSTLILKNASLQTLWDVQKAAKLCHIVAMEFEILGKNATMLGMMEMAATITAMSKMDSPASGMSVKRQFVLKLVVMGFFSLH